MLRPRTRTVRGGMRYVFRLRLSEQGCTDWTRSDTSAHCLRIGQTASQSLIPLILPSVQPYEESKADTAKIHDITLDIRNLSTQSSTNPVHKPSIQTVLEMRSTGESGLARDASRSSEHATRRAGSATTAR
jgi:hypothetical protein